jgi:hypothetical protein
MDPPKVIFAVTQNAKRPALNDCATTIAMHVSREAYELRVRRIRQGASR